MPERYLTREQVREVDRRAILEYGMTGLVLMENAGRGCADLLCEQGINGPVAICCGKGNNAGDGFVVARHLDARGHDVRILLFCDPAELACDAAANYQTLEAAGLPIGCCPDGDYESWLSAQLAGVDWIVDALLGTGARGEPRPPLDAVLDFDRDQGDGDGGTPLQHQRGLEGGPQHLHGLRVDLVHPRPFVLP